LHEGAVLGLSVEGEEAEFERMERIKAQDVEDGFVGSESSSRSCSLSLAILLGSASSSH
jgi:hypothetical protein